MLLIRHLDSLRRHGEWADARLLDALRAAAAQVPAALRELAHVRGAQEIWLARIEGRAPTLAVWPETSVEELARAGTAVDLAMGRMSDALTDAALDRAVSYTNTALRAAGAEPASVDYIVWPRTVAPT